MLKLFPDKIVAGCDCVHTVAVADYSSNDYTAELVIKVANLSPVRIVSNEQNLNEFEFNITSELLQQSSINTIAAAQFFVTNKKSNLRSFIGSGQVSIIPDLKSVDADFDCRSHNRKVLDSINAVLEDRATESESELEVGGAVPRKIKSLSHTELYKFKQIYEDRCYYEELAEYEASGGTVRDYTVVRFGKC
ncbi:hypothetical protein AAEX28_12475 [Lentisphaerota bacterium WC36G]|nr:hypothetical protein LJT99_15300 [Lentisphaerae bacterium WC36]